MSTLNYLPSLNALNLRVKALIMPLIMEKIHFGNLDFVPNSENGSVYEAL